MPIFTRRRLQGMLEDLAPHLDEEKRRDLLGRLNDRKRVDQVLPAEMELALLWALSKLGDLEVEPYWWGDECRPDAFTDALVPGCSCAIEVAAPNDNALSGEEAMDRVAREIQAIASEAQKKAGDFLSFNFRETSAYDGGVYRRWRLAPVDYVATPRIQAAVRNWITSGRSLHQTLRLTEPGLDVIVERHNWKQIRYHNIFSSMPPETHSLDDNPLFELLGRKKRQLRAAGDGVLRLLFLADVGSTLLNNIGRIGEGQGRHVSGREIIEHFLRTEQGKVDGIAVFVPRRDRRRVLQFHDEKRWAVTFFGTPALPQAPAGLLELAEVLPAPRFEGYQARSLFRQGAFAPTGKGWHLGMKLSNTTDTHMSVSFSARMLLDLLAGRVTPEQFQARIGGTSGKDNIFRHWLDMGMTISAAKMAPRDIDEDDDHLVLTFSEDPAAQPLKLPSSDLPEV